MTSLDVSLVTPVPSTLVAGTLPAKTSFTMVADLIYDTPDQINCKVYECIITAIRQPNVKEFRPTAEEREGNKYVIKVRTPRPNANLQNTPLDYAMDSLSSLKSFWQMRQRFDNSAFPQPPGQYKAKLEDCLMRGDLCALVEIRTNDPNQPTHGVMMPWDGVSLEEVMKKRARGDGGDKALPLGEIFHQEDGKGKFTEEEVLKIAHSLRVAVTPFHRTGYTHCDIKPGNILVRQDASGTTHYVLIDDERTKFAAKRSEISTIQIPIDVKPPANCVPRLDYIYMLSTCIQLLRGRVEKLRKKKDVLDRLEHVKNKDLKALLTQWARWLEPIEENKEAKEEIKVEPALQQDMEDTVAKTRMAMGNVFAEMFKKK
ncbi:hypothetical protein F66182_7224 [Fusarium sp. NRRL 66182]|nr:hypothetical protein F66182_7224 [Fusarium sp. NRRL 66182]